MFQSLAEVTLEKCNSSWGRPSDCNYISESQQEFILQKLHLQLHFKICQNLNCNHLGVDSMVQLDCKHSLNLFSS